MIAANDPSLRSWEESAQGSDFPIQNLPFGIFSERAGTVPRAGTRIGNKVVDVAALQDARLNFRGVFSASLRSIASSPWGQQPGVRRGRGFRIY
jgi:Fumarylacetoacetase N-terminal